MTIEVQRLNPWDAWAIKACRVCSGTALTELFSLGVQAVSDFVPADKVHDGVKCPIELVLCRGCGLVQQRYTAPQDFMYSRHYWYVSSTTKTMRDALREITAAIEGRLDLKAGDIVIDVGSNDGCLLRSYAVDRLCRIGIEPANNLANAGNYEGLELVKSFWPCDDLLPEAKAKCITAIGMFYDSPDPSEFVAAVARSLRPDGMFIAQLMCLRQTLDLGDVGNLVHEHLEFYSLRSLQTLYGRHGLEIFDVEENNVNGGSYRVWARLKENTLPPKPKGCVQRLEGALRWETGFEDLQTYSRFISLAKRNRDECLAFIRRAFGEGKRTWWYGASTKSAVLTQWYGLWPGVIEAAADKSEEKIGKCMVGSGIPIKSCEDFRAANPEYAIVGPWAFRQEFLKNEAEWRAKGGRFIFPLPKFEVV